MAIDWKKFDTIFRLLAAVHAALGEDAVRLEISCVISYGRQFMPDFKDWGKESSPVQGCHLVNSPLLCKEQYTDLRIFPHKFSSRRSQLV